MGVRGVTSGQVYWSTYGESLFVIGRIGFYSVAAVLTAAHFLRLGDLAAVMLCLCSPLLFFIRRNWAVLVLQGLAYAAALLWAVTAWQIVSIRFALGEPWSRAGIILLAVAAFTASAGALLRSRTFQKAYLGR
jgi:low temperature requirement protein LtrA